MAFSIKVEAIVPKALDVAKVQQYIDQALNETGKILDRGFYPTINSWAGDRPSFGHQIGRTGKSAWVHSGPKGAGVAVEKWRRIDEGTKQNYPIRPRKRKYLRYRKEFAAKTTPGVLGSRPGGKYGDWTTRDMVVHPGVTPRQWSKTLGEREIGPFVVRIQNAVTRGLGGK